MRSQPAVEIEVCLPALLQPYTDGCGVLSVTATTLASCFEALIERYPLLERHLFDESGNRREHVLFFLNEQDTRWLESQEISLSEGDRLTILQAVSGG